MFQSIAVWCGARRSARGAAGSGAAVRGAAVSVLLAGALGGCALAFPLPGLFAEPETTQSLPAKREAAPPAAQGVAPGSRAAAFAQALDPQGGGGRATWAEPAGRSRGHVEAVGSPYVSGAEICRRFELVTDARGAAPAKTERGVACRESGEPWRRRS